MSGGLEFRGVLSRSASQPQRGEPGSPLGASTCLRSTGKRTSAGGGGSTRDRKGGGGGKRGDVGGTGVQRCALPICEPTATRRAGLASGVVHMFEVHGKTDVGRRRQLNEDAIFAAARLFIVCAGMGGHKAGEVASRLATDVI